MLEINQTKNQKMYIKLRNRAYSVSYFKSRDSLKLFTFKHRFSFFEEGLEAFGGIVRLH